MQVDIGFGDAVTPGVMQSVYPVLIAALPAPRLRIYPVYKVIAEKLHTIVLLGMINTRLIAIDAGRCRSKKSGVSQNKKNESDHRKIGDRHEF